MEAVLPQQVFVEVEAIAARVHRRTAEAIAGRVRTVLQILLMMAAMAGW
jgi:hypothetical protein